MIGIVDYGLGNISAFANVYKILGVDCKLVATPEELATVDRIILPGVGAFDHAMTALNNSGMREQLDKMVLEQKVPVVGICVGMQMMAKSSEEGTLPGLGWIDAKVKKMDVTQLRSKTHLPHMGWNTISKNGNPMFTGLPDNPRFYFLHSYYFECTNEGDSIACSNYGFEFTCAANYENVYGIQFHPEKSHQNGVQLLKNFATV